MVAYNRSFDLELVDVTLIEESLAERASTIAKTIREQNDTAHDQIARLKQQLADVREVLGRIHNQKIWYTPKQYMPQG